MIIGGALRARGVDAYYCDDSLDVRGTLRVDRLVIERHGVKAGAFAVGEQVGK